MRRQSFLSLAGASVSFAAASPAFAARLSGTKAEIARLYASVPGTTAYEFSVGGKHPWVVALSAERPLFMGSCFKTFVLAAYLQEVERGRLSLDEPLAVSSAVRSLISPVVGDLTGRMPARSVLEAMIAHSDNTATDIAMRRVGAEKVRAFIARAGLRDTRIPESTRRFFSYVAGYPKGVDAGWAGMEAIMADKVKSPPRPAFNPVESMYSTPAQMVSYYERVLRGEFFAKQESLVEFKRISWMADAIFRAVPDGTPAYMKGGSINWNGFYAVALCGQMLAGSVPITMAVMTNWHDKDATEAAGAEKFKAATLAATTRLKSAAFGS